MLDVHAAPGDGTHDQLVLGGTASGSTVLNSLRGGALLNAGFSHYGLRYDATGDDFVITAAESLGLFQALKTWLVRGAI